MADLSVGLLRRFCLLSMVVPAGVSLVARWTFAHRPVHFYFTTFRLFGLCRLTVPLVPMAVGGAQRVLDVEMLTLWSGVGQGLLVWWRSVRFGFQLCCLLTSTLL